MRVCDSTRPQVTICLCLLFLFNVSLCLGKDFKRIILLETMDVKVVRDRSYWFTVQLMNLGYREGVNMELLVLKANGSAERAESLLQEALEKDTPDLVVSNATLASQTAAKLLKDTDIPQLFVTVSDPVGAGLVKKTGIPSGKNITGRVHNITRETKIKLVLRLIRDKVKTRPIRFGYIHSSYPSSVGDIRQLKAIAENNQDITFVPYEITYKKFPENIDYMLKELSEGLKQLEGKIDFLWEPLGPFAESIEYNNLLNFQATVPVVYGVNRESAQLGALIYLAPDPEAEGREVGLLADKILKGEPAGNIPVIPPVKFNLGINVTTAQKMNIVVPPDILKLARENVFH